MDTNILIPTLAKKYGFDISSPDKVMELFNHLCTVQDQVNHYNKLYDKAVKERDEFKELGLIKGHQKKLAEEVVLELNQSTFFETRKECNKALQKRKVKLDLMTGFVYPKCDTHS